MHTTSHTLIRRLTDQHDEQAWHTFAQTYRSYIVMVLHKTCSSPQKLDQV